MVLVMTDAGVGGMPIVSYSGRRVAFLTQHGKERVIAPVLEPALGCCVERVTGYDTDRLGTFTRDIPRAGTQLEAARRKARIGMDLAGLPLGLASEGAFGLDPFVGMLSWNIEFLVFLDDERDLELIGVMQGKGNFAHVLASDWAAAEDFARQVGFPDHQLVVRPERQEDLRIRKGLAAWSDLEEAFNWALEQSANGQVFLEMDARAYANPTRMNHIRLAAENLACKLRSPCPVCGTPGFWVTEHLTGLPCMVCGMPTREARAEILACLKCTHRITRHIQDRQAADPGCCDYCNP